MTAYDALRKYPGVLEWMVVSYSIDTNKKGYEVELQIVGPLVEGEHDEACIREVVPWEGVSRVQDVSENFKDDMKRHQLSSFAPMCACFIDDCLIAWEEKVERQL